jgi:hypothetical protein
MRLYPPFKETADEIPQAPAEEVAKMDKEEEDNLRELLLARKKKGL